LLAVQLGRPKAVHPPFHPPWCQCRRRLPHGRPAVSGADCFRCRADCGIEQHHARRIYRNHLHQHHRWRSGPTQWHDGKRGGVSLKENSTTNESSDRFTLDGQRLVITSGTWGAPGSTYGTEIDTFSRITALGDTNAGPLSWKVETKAGLTCEYGATADSRARANRASISGDDALLSLC
jgi:hypothetical protein